MKPRLFAVTGPLKGSTFNLTETESSLGRESANRVAIGDMSLSRRHCVVARAGDDFTITDLSSRNGTFVNGVAVKQQSLAHGDHVRLGDSVFVFLLGTDDAAAASSVRLSDDALLTGQTLLLRREEARYLDAEKVQAALPRDERMARDLNALLKISHAVHAARDIEKLQARLLPMIAEVIPAERGALLLVEEGEETGEFASVFGWDRRAGAGGEVVVSRTIAYRALMDGAAILSNDALDQTAVDGAQSLLAANARSLLAVPLTVLEQKLGVLWLTTGDPIVWFDEDHLQLAVAIADIAAPAFASLRRVAWLESENRRLHAESNEGREMIGASPRLNDIWQRIQRVAPTDATVLIRGESGTGKELVARAVHQHSERANQPFIAINCAALTETLLESELFGHEKGAFTGAVAQKKGRIELAAGGTLFLDEIGEMPALLQAKLLRVLQEREFERVGGTRTIKADIRLIAATNRDLEAEIKAGGFRADLYYRLNVVTITTPPLRERREDIDVLASHFVTKYAARCKRRVRGLSPGARSVLARYDWPGNVRELENAIERAVVLGIDELIQVEDLPEAILEVGVATGAHEAAARTTETNPPTPGNYHEALVATKKDLIRAAIEQAGGSITEAARLLGVQANYLHRLISNLDLRAELKK